MFDLHMHSTFSDGKHPPEEMVAEGIRKGLKRIGLSEHSFVEMDDASMLPENEEAYRAEMRRLKKKYAGIIEIRCGLERDYYSEEGPAYDYVIGSVHWVRMPDGHRMCVDWTPEKLEADCRKYFAGDWYALAEAYYQVEADVVRKTKCDIIGHFDLVTKFNERENWFDVSHPRYTAAWQAAAEALLRTGKPFEVNTGAISRGYRTDAYPAKPIRAYLLGRGAKLILSSDAHRKEDIAFAFDRFLPEI
ncbi:MAG: histidinol-phosphatase [Clostridia bacterium]|nr:histidinol-phosphatase [Clostridia bacterium]